MDWQPIETAPKDGTRVILFERGGRWENEWNDFEGRHVDAIEVGLWEENDVGYGKWSGYYSGREPVQEPTHWMPLPPPPKD